MKRIFLLAICMTIFVMLPLLAQAMEPKIPIDGQILNSETKPFDTGDYQGKVTVKELEDNITVKDLDYGPNGEVEGRMIRQEFPDGTSMQELDKGADGSIERRMTVVEPDVSVVLFEKELPDGSIEKERHTFTENGAIVEILDSNDAVIDTYTYEIGK